VEITNIDDVNESFGAHGHLSFKMKVEAMDTEEEMNYEGLKNAGLHHEIPFRPNDLFFTNIKECHWDHDESEFEVHNGVLIGYIEWEATFYDSIDLKRFPFDRQSMNIGVRFMDFEKEKDLKVMFYDEQVKIHFASSATSHEWHIAPSIEHYGMRYDKDHGGPTSLEVRFRIERIPTFYVRQVVLPLFLVVLLGWTSSTVDLMDVSSRLGVSLTLLLTAVAFKYIVAEFLPRVPYTTYLDAYVLMNFSMLFFGAMEQAIVKVISDHNGDEGLEIAMQFDRIFWFIIYLPYTVLHFSVLFARHWVEKHLRLDWKLVEENDDLMEGEGKSVQSIVATPAYEAVGSFEHSTSGGAVHH